MKKLLVLTSTIALLSGVVHAQTTVQPLTPNGTEKHEEKIAQKEQHKAEKLEHKKEKESEKAEKKAERLEHKTAKENKKLEKSEVTK